MQNIQCEVQKYKLAPQENKGYRASSAMVCCLSHLLISWNVWIGVSLVHMLIYVRYMRCISQKDPQHKWPLIHPHTGGRRIAQRWLKGDLRAFRSSNLLDIIPHETRALFTIQRAALIDKHKTHTHRDKKKCKPNKRTKRIHKKPHMTTINTHLGKQDLDTHHQQMGLLHLLSSAVKPGVFYSLNSMLTLL